MEITIDAFLTPFFPETETQFDDAVIIMIDVLRASSTVCAALKNGAKEVITSDTLDKAVSIYSNLSKDVRFLGGERNSLKPNGFDAGNSPLEFTEEVVSQKNVVLTTSNGTKVFQKAKQAKCRLVGGFVNIDAIIAYIDNEFMHLDKENLNITILCAGTDGRLSYEDTLCAGAYIDSLCRLRPDAHSTDTALASRNLFELHSDNLAEFLKTREHAGALIEKGFARDIEICFSYNIYPVVPVIDGTSIKKAY